MRDIRSGTQVLFLYKLKRLTSEGTVVTVYYAATGWQSARDAAQELNNDGQILSIEVLRPVHVVLSSVR